MFSLDLYQLKSKKNFKFSLCYLQGNQGLPQKMSVNLVQPFILQYYLFLTLEYKSYQLKKMYFNEFLCRHNK